MSGRTPFGVIEALRFENDPEGHICRLRKHYTQALPFYFMLVYLPKGSLDSKWKQYKQKVSGIGFKAHWRAGKKGEIVEDIIDPVIPEDMRVGKNAIGDRITLYHILVKTEF